MSIKIPVPPDDMLDPRQPKKPSRVWREFFEKLGNAGNAVAVLPDGYIFVGSASNTPSAVQMTGDLNITNTGVTTLQATANTAEIAQDAVGAMVDSTLLYNDGTPSLGRAAITGDVTISAGSNAATIPNDTITFAKFQNITDNRLLGRSAGSSGDMMEITVGSGLSLAAGTLSASGGGDVTGPASSGDGNVALFNGLTGKIIKDGGTPEDLVMNAGYWSCVGNGDLADPKIVFDGDGVPVVVWVSL